MSAINLVEFNDPGSTEAEVYRALRTKIKFLSYQKGIKTIAVTSARTGDGKTTVCANLGAFMAQSGSRVLIVDGNLRNPSLHKIFMMANNKGITNILSRDIPFRDAVSGTGVKNLDIMLCGPKPPNPSDILNFERVKKILAEMKKDYDFIFVDTGSVVEITDSILLTSACDGTILVVALEGTNTENVLKAREFLKDANADILGIVLNKVRTTSRDRQQKGSRKSLRGRGAE